MFVKFCFRILNIRRFVENKILNKNYNKVVSRQVHHYSYKYLLILDFEATCDKVKLPVQEIIEFPCLKVNLSNMLIEARFHEYVRPVCAPKLSPFCIELTGIIQNMVDDADAFTEVFYKFEKWRATEGLTEQNSLYLTSGDWDLGHMMPEQCTLSNLKVPSHMKEWADVKKVFGSYVAFFNSFNDIIKYYKLETEGRAHSGIDDCLNMYRVVKKMTESGMIFRPTSRRTGLKVETVRFS